MNNISTNFNKPIELDRNTAVNIRPGETDKVADVSAKSDLVKGVEELLTKLLPLEQLRPAPAEAAAKTMPAESPRPAPASAQAPEAAGGADGGEGAGDKSFMEKLMELLMQIIMQALQGAATGKPDQAGPVLQK